MKKTIFFIEFFAILNFNAQSWNTTGNAGTNPSTDFIGTTDNNSLVLKTNNLEQFRIFPEGTFKVQGVVGANSVVKGVFPDYCVIVGAPAKIVKKYNLETKTWEKV